MMYQYGSKRGRIRLQEAVRQSRKYLAPFRRNRRSHIQQFVGVHYSKNGAPKAVPKNLIEQMHTVLLTQLASSNPRALVTTEEMHLKGEAVSREYAINKEIRRMNLAKFGRGVVSDTLFGGMGIGKIGIAEYGRFRLNNVERVLTRPYAARVSLDNWVHDMAAPCWPDVEFMGDMYAVPRKEALASDLYDQGRLRKAISEAEWQTTDEYGIEKTQAITRDETHDAVTDQYSPNINLVDLWFPHEGKLCTFLGTQNRDVDWIICGEPVREVFWEGPPNGMYRFLGFKEVPDNTMCKSAIGDIRDLHDALNGILRKVIRQSLNAKGIYAYSGASADDAQRIQRARDMDMIRLDRGNEAGQFLRFDSMNPQHMGLVSWFGQQANEIGGNFALLSGAGPAAETYGQDRLLHNSASQLVEAMQEHVELFMRDVMEDIAFYLFDDPELDMKIRKEIPKTDMEIETRMTQKSLQGNFHDFQFEIEPYSMKPRSPQERLAGMNQMFQMSMQFAQMGMLDQAGMTINAQGFLDTMARYLNIVPEWKDMMVASEEPLNVQDKSSNRMMGDGKHSVYERTNKTVPSREAQENEFMQSMINSKPDAGLAPARPSDGEHDVMPVYRYKSEAGEEFERFFRIKEAPDEIFVEGVEYVKQIELGTGRVIVKSHNGVGGNPCSTWPRESSAMGVAAEQVPEAMAEDRRKGVPTDYTADGDPILTSPGHEKQYMKAHGFHHRGGAMGAEHAAKSNKIEVTDG